MALWGALAVPSVVVGQATTQAAGGAGDEVLRGKGLVRVEGYYLLEADAGLPQLLKNVRQAKKRLDEQTAKRAAAEAQVRQAGDRVAQLYRQLADSTQRLGRSPESNQLVAEHNGLLALIAEAERARDAAKQRLAGMGDSGGEYASAVIVASDAMEEAAKLYEEMAEDDAVKGALAQVTEQQGRGVVRLGPSAQFQQELRPMRRLRETVDSGVVRLEFEAGVPTVTATLNDSVEQRMVVDSGAGIVTLTAEVARKLGIKPDKEDEEVELVTASGEHTKGRLATLRTLRVGAFTVADVPCAIMDKAVKGDNLLGGTFLRHFVYQMDLGAKELRLTQVSGKPATTSDWRATTRAAGAASRPVYWPASEWTKHIVGDTKNRVGEAIVLHTGERLATDRPFAPPVMFRVQAKTDGTNLRLGYACDQMIFNWEMDPKQFRIDGGPVGGQHKPGAGEIPVNRWVEVEITVLPDVMVVKVNGKERYRANGDFSKIDEPLVIFTARGGMVTVRSVIAMTPPTGR